MSKITVIALLVAASTLAFGTAADARVHHHGHGGHAAHHKHR